MFAVLRWRIVFAVVVDDGVSVEDRVCGVSVEDRVCGVSVKDRVCGG